MASSEGAGVGLRLRQARESMGLSRAKLAQLVGIREGTITKAEGRASAPDSATLLKLARALNQDPWYLTFGEATQPAMIAAPTGTGSPSLVELRLELLQIVERQESSVVEVFQRLEALEKRVSAKPARGRKAG